MWTFQEHSDEAVEHGEAVLEFFLLHGREANLGADFGFQGFEKLGEFPAIEVIMGEEEIHRQRIIELLVQKNPRYDRQLYFTKFIDPFNEVALLGGRRLEDQVAQFQKKLKIRIQRIGDFWLALRQFL